MSYRWGLVCEKCNERSPYYYNHGEDDLRSIVKLWPQIAALEEATFKLPGGWRIEINIEPAWEDVPPKQFLYEHYDHRSLALYSEYADYEALDLPVEASPAP